MEAKAVHAVFGNSGVPASTTKPVTGHTLGAAGALEAAVCYACIEKNCGGKEIKLPVQVWDKRQDSEIPALNIIDSENNKNSGKVKICLSNSFAFGGANSSLIIGIN